MNRVNFAGVSRVVIDICRKDGVWFDRGELTAIVDFLEHGGLEKSRSRDREKLREELSDLQARKVQAGMVGGFPEEDRGADVLRKVIAFLLGVF